MTIVTINVTLQMFQTLSYLIFYSSGHLGLAGYGYGTTLIASQEIKQQYHFTQFF